MIWHDFLIFWFFSRCWWLCLRRMRVGISLVGWHCFFGWFLYMFGLLLRHGCECRGVVVVLRCRNNCQIFYSTCSMVNMRTGVSRSEVLGRFYNPNTTPKDKERVVVCLCGTGQELHWKGYYTKGIDAEKEQRWRRMTGIGPGLHLSLGQRLALE